MASDGRLAYNSFLQLKDGRNPHLLTSRRSHTTIDRMASWRSRRGIRKTPSSLRAIRFQVEMTNKGELERTCVFVE